MKIETACTKDEGKSLLRDAPRIASNFNIAAALPGASSTAVKRSASHGCFGFKESVIFFVFVVIKSPFILLPFFCVDTWCLSI